MATSEINAGQIALPIETTSLCFEIRMLTKKTYEMEISHDIAGNSYEGLLCLRCENRLCRICKEALEASDDLDHMPCQLSSRGNVL